jgi:hypothetical protein
MLQILFTCARTGQFVPTGIETDLNTFIALPEVLALSQCPACGRSHYWTKSTGPKARLGFPIRCGNVPRHFPRIPSSPATNSRSWCCGKLSPANTNAGPTLSSQSVCWSSPRSRTVCALHLLRCTEIWQPTDVMGQNRHIHDVRAMSGSPPIATKMARRGKRRKGR